MIYEAEIQSSFLVRFRAAVRWNEPVRVAGTPQHNDRILADVLIVTETRGLLLEFKRTDEHYATEWEKPVKEKLLDLVGREHHLRPASDRGHWLVTLECDRGSADHVLDQYAATLRAPCYDDEPGGERITFADFVACVQTEELGMTVSEFATYVELLTEISGEGKVNDVIGLFVNGTSGLVELNVGAGLHQLLRWARRNERTERFSGFLGGRTRRLGR